MAGVRLVAAVAAVGVLGVMAAAPAPAADHVHVIAGFSYLPGDTLCKDPVTTCPQGIPDSAPVGDTMTFVNADAVAHTVTSDTGAFNSGDIATGGKFTTPALPRGTYRYHCTRHPTLMRGAFTIS